MSDIGEVLSDVHVECQSHSVKDHKVTRFNVKIPVLGNQLCCNQNCYADKKSHSFMKKSHKCADSCTSSSNRQSDNNLQYDSDGDLVLDRQVHKHNVTVNSPVRKKSKVDQCDFVPSTSIGEKRDSLVKCSEEKIDNDCVRKEFPEDVKSDISCDEILTRIVDNNDQSMEGGAHERARYSRVEKFAHECWVQNNMDKKCQYCLTDSCTCISGAQSSSTQTDSDRLKECKQCSCCQEEYFITIKHSLATRLQDVGQQVWHGSLLLSDYIVHHSDKFTDKVIIDLGAGVGLTSIVTAMYASTVYSTDVGNDVLTLNEDNIVAARTFPTLPHPVGDILVKELDWFQGLKELRAMTYLVQNLSSTVYMSKMPMSFQRENP
ncbi:Methyltransferase-like protein 22 [Mactra antiquata]